MRHWLHVFGRTLALIFVLATTLVVVSVIRGDGPWGERPAQEKPSAEQLAAQQHAAELTYSDLLDAKEQKQIERVAIDPTAGELLLQYKNAPEPIQIGIPSDASGQLARDLSKAGAEVEVRSREDSALDLPGGKSNELISWLIIGVVLAAIFAGMHWWRRRPGSIGVRADQAGRERITFADVAGCDEAVEEVSEFAEFLSDPDRFQRLGATMPSGCVLYGPPGTGKTLLGRALAGESGVPFFYASGSEFVNRFVGVGAKNIRDLFNRARATETGAVLFIDEIDAIGGRRTGDGGGNDEREQTLNQLLTELDGFVERDRIVVIAATNRVELLDPALLRPGRLSRRVQVSLPGESGRREILRLHSKGKPLAGDVDLGRLAKITAGSSGADLRDMINEAAIMAARSESDVISQADLEEGHLRVLAGPERRESMLAEGEREIIAHHEAGHVLCAELCESQDKAQRATIKARGIAAGMAVYGRSDRALHSSEYLREQLICILGGRAAERVIFSTVSSGAANDLEQANTLARRAVEQWGFSSRLGQITKQNGRLSDPTQRLIDEEVEAMVAEAYGEACKLLEDNRPQLEGLAGALLEHEDIDRAQIIAAMGGTRAPRRQRALPGPDDRPALRRRRPAPALNARSRGAGLLPQARELARATSQQIRRRRRLRSHAFRRTHHS